MYLTSKTIITFVLPDEAKAYKTFSEANDMSKWVAHEASQGITYVREDRYVIDVRKGAGS